MEFFDESYYLKRVPSAAESGLTPWEHYRTIGWPKGHDPHPLFGVRWYLERYPDVAKAGTEPLSHYLKRGWKEGHNPHPLFSVPWYLERYPDVAKAGTEPLGHYLEHGWIDGRDPHPLFSVRWYLERYPDVAKAGTEPLSHYLKHGWKEGHDPHPLFSLRWYLKRYPDVAKKAGTEPLSHYLKHGWKEGRNPHPLFSVRWYLECYPDVAKAGTEPFGHYLENGWTDGRNPHPIFSVRWYLERYPDAAKAGEPLRHYLEYGWKDGKNPYPLFSVRWYLERYPNVAKAGTEPLLHYLERGWKDGCNPHPLFSARWYLERYPDAAKAGAEPLGHYLQYGWKARLNPHPLFDVDWYLSENRDVAESGVEPLGHYLEYGWRARLNPHPLFDVNWYLSENRDVAESGVEPLGHYLEYGWREGRSPHPLFDVRYYLSQAPQLVDIGVEPLAHFLEHGSQNGLWPNRLFDSIWYSMFNCHSMSHGENALRHYVTSGWKHDCDPHPSFSISLYLEENPEVRSKREDPLAHYLRRGAPGRLMPDIPLQRPDPEIGPAEPDVKAIAFYLPQFHSIPENDEWWGKGFTEWTNVRRGSPQFWDHYQPHIPHDDIGFYDLTDASVLEKQAQMARQFGIHGFCFFYYWFNGRRLLEMPTNRLIRSGKPDFPFCFCWANHDWTRRWDGHEGVVLMAQEHSNESEERFIQDLLPAFRDRRYIRINGRPLLVLYRPGLLSDPRVTFAHWRESCRREGIGEIYLAAFKAYDLHDPAEFGLDAAVECPHHILEVPNGDGEQLPVFNRFRGIISDYRRVVENCLKVPQGNFRLFRGVMPSWDNTARRQEQGIIFVGSNPQVYCRWLHRVVLQTRRLPNSDERLIFINAWNEWGEGAHLEPDKRYEYAWLNATRLALEVGSSQRNTAAISDMALQNIEEKVGSELKQFLANDQRLSFRSKNQPDVSVIVTLVGPARFTLRCLRAVLAQTGVSIEVLLADDRLDNGEDALLARLDNVRVVRNRKNACSPFATSQAAVEARGRAILLLHSDAVMRENALTIALQTLSSDNRIGAVGGRLVSASGHLEEAGNIVWNDASTQAYGRNLPMDAGEVMFRRDVDCCSDAFLLTPRAVLEQTGGLDDVYAPAHYGAADYCLRLWRAGFRVVYEPGAVIDHYESCVGDRSENATPLMRRNRKRLRATHMSELRLQHLPPLQANVLFARNHIDQRQRLLVIEEAVPLTALGSGYPRMCAILNEAVAAGWFVTLYPLHFSAVNWEAAYAELSREIEISNGRGISGLSGFLSERLGYYDIILVSRPSNMAPIKEVVRNQPHLLAGSRVIYDAEAIFAARDILRAEYEGRPMSALDADALIAQEIKLADDADAVVAVSSAEAQILRERQSAPVHLLSHPTRARWDTPRWEERAGFLFVGRLLDKTCPNYEGLTWFLRSVWPEIHAVLTDATLFVAGAVNREPAELVGPGIQLLGKIEDLGPLYDQARVFISPARFAAGVPIKILEAGASGLPVVGTKLMAAQLGWQPGVEIEATDDPQEMARAAITLYSDAELWGTMRTAVLHRMTQEYSEANFRHELRALLEGDDPLGPTRRQAIHTPKRLPGGKVLGRTAGVPLTEEQQMDTQLTTERRRPGGVRTKNPHLIRLLRTRGLSEAVDELPSPAPIETDGHDP